MSKILTELQTQMLKIIFDDKWFRENFYLTGGTALAAFYFHHRLSEDLDFFSHGVELKPIPKFFSEIEKKHHLKIESVKTSPYFHRYLINDELKIDVVADIDFRVGSPKLIDDFMVDNLKNIAVNKVGTILSRLEVKDYVDLYFILNNTGYDIFELMKLAQQKDGGVEAFTWASLVADVKTLKLLPKMVKKLELKTLQAFFLALRDKILDAIRPKK